MKKISLFLVIILNIILINHPIKNAKATNIYANNADLSTNYGYYKCLSSCYFFTSPDTTNINYDNVQFIIPEGYFVKKISDISATTLKVSYNNKIGYVSQNTVKLISFLPQIKYLKNITFDIISTSGTQLRSSPTTDDKSNIIFNHIEQNTKNINFIGEIIGEIPPGLTSSIWYFCSFSPSSDPTSVYEGYIHSEKTINLSPIPENTEDDKVINEANNSNQTPFGLSTNLQTILIALISIPLLATILLLILNSKRKEKQKLESIISSSNNYEITEQKNNLNTVKEKKFTLKDKFNNFMFESKPQKASDYTKNKGYGFSNLDTIDDDDLL